MSTNTKTTRRTTKTALLAMLALVLAVVAAGAFTGNARALYNGYSSSPSIVSDKQDYMPGETVTLTGYNWAPGESVHIFVNDDVGQTWSRNVDVTAGDDGVITDQFQLPTTFVADYSVTATGATSGTAKTAFTDGNVKFDVAPTGTTAQFVETVYTSGTNCPSGGTVKSGFPKTVSGSAGDTVGVGTTESVRIDAAATSDQGGSFSGWSTTDSPASPFTVINGTGGRSVCIAGFQSGNRNYRATYNAPAPQNQAPAIASTNASVNVNEGATAANTGTWSDGNAGDTVTLSASIGSVTKSGTNASGTWSWSFGTTDGPTQSQTVTITANDGNGGVTTTTFSLGVSNATPAVTAPAGQTATQGVSKSFTLGSFTDPGADTPWGVTVNWGDGGSNTTFNLPSTGTITAQSHTFANPGTFTVTVSVADKDGATGSASFSVVVAANNHAPTANAGGPYSGNEGSAIQLDGSGSSDPDAGDTLTYAWSAGAAPCSFSSATAQKPTITCTDNGSFTVSLTVTDNHGASSASASSAALNVANVAPSSTFSAGGPVNEGQSFQLSLTGTTDPSTADQTAGFQYAFDCGDGSGYGAFGASNTRTCSTTDDGIRSVKGKVKDKDGGVSEYTGSVTVNNVTPAVTAAANQSATEGVAKSFALGSFTDPGPDSPWAVTVSWGDGSTNTTFNQTSTGTITAQSHTYATPGPFTVTVSVKDKDNATGSASFTVNVAAANHAPTANAGGPYSGNEGSAIQLDGSGSSDPDAGDTLTYAWSAGAAPCSFSSATAQKPTITCTDNGSFTVSLTVTDNHGASSASASSAALNVANVAPSSTFSAGGPVNEGQSFLLSLTGTTDPSSTDQTAGFQYAFDCGDGSGYGAFGASNTRTCSTTDDGIRSVKGKVKDKDGGVSEYTGSVTVNNVAPTIVSVTNDGPIDEGGSATITVTATDPAGAADPLSYEFDCNNDGIYEVGPQAGNSHACSFANNGSKQVNVRVSDGDGGSATGSTTVTVKNVAPTIQSVTNDGPIDEGGSATVTVTATDPADTLSYEFDCNNDSTFEVGPQAGSSHACSFADDGSKQVNVRVSDGDGGSATGSTTVTVRNVAPTATFSNDGPVDEGSSFHLSLTGASDPSAADTAAGFQYAFDCGGGSGYGAFGASNTATCSAGDDGTRSVKGKIRDKDGGVSEYTGTVVVKNVAPTLSGQSDQTADEGSSKSFDLGSFSDPGADSPWKVHVDWGDGSSSDPADKTSTGSLGNASHTYGDDGSYTVTVKVTDKDGGVGQATFKVTVANVPPTASLSNNGPVDEGSPATVSFSGQSDPSSADTAAGFHYAYDCANGSLAGVTYATAGTSASAQCAYADNGTHTVRARIFDKDNGSSEYTTSVTVKNVAPSLTPPADDNGLEGSSKSFGLGSFSDPGANDSPWHLHVTWGDGSAAYDQDYNSRGALGMAPHAYADNGSYTVTETLTDKDGGSDTQTFKVEIANVDPTASLSNDGPVDEGSAATVSVADQSDPSSADTAAGFHYAYACDNSSLAGATYAGSGAAATKQCTFADDGTYPVRARIVDKDGGFSEYTTSVVVHNVAPDVTAGADDSVDEGSAKSFDLGSFSDPGADSPWKVHVDWGDGSSSDPADKTSTGSLGNASHTYGDDGEYTVTVKVTDKDGGSGQATFKVTVANVPPTASLSNDGPVDEGSPATVSFSGQSDPSSADTAAGFHYAYDCANGSLAGVTYATAGTSASATCTYADNGTYTVRARIFDKDNGSSEYTTSVTVKNVAPSLTPPADDNGLEGSSKSFGLGSFSDPGANDDPWHLHVTWGDGSAAYDHDYASQGALGMAPHAYADNGSYTVTETLTDKDGGSDTQTFKVEIANVDPTASLSNDGPVDEGSAATISFADQSDPSSADTAAGFHYAYACDNGSLAGATYAGSGAAATKQCTFADDGTYPVRARIIDKDGGFSEYTTNVVVQNVPPSVTAPADQGSDEGSSASFDLGSFSDPGADSPWKVHVDWGDGSSSDPADKTSTGSLGSASHTYDDDGSYTVNVKVTDKDGGVGQATFKVDVKNVAPAASLGNDGPVDEGSPATVSFSNQDDPSDTDTTAGFHYSYACDGNAGSLASSYAGVTDGASKQCTFADNGSYLVKGRIFDKDGGSNTYDTTVQVQNVKPSLTAPSDDNGVEGSSKSFGLGSFSDPGANDDPWHLHVTWGDGSAAYDHDYASRGALGMSPHAYADNGTYTVTETITDKDGGSDTQTFKVEVANVPPDVTAPADQSADEGDSTSFGLGSFSDPGANDDPWKVHGDWGDGSSSNPADRNATGSLGNASHTYDDNGSYTVKVTVTDKDGGSDDASFKVDVRNVAPTASLGNDGPVDEGSPATVSFSGQHDPSGADTAAGFHYAYDCANGSLAGVTYATAGTSASATCTYADNGTYTVRARIFDKDNGSSEYTTAVVVKNVPPSLSPPSDDTANEGESKTFGLGSFSDPGANDDPWHLHVTWGDGSAAYDHDYSSQGALGMSPHAYADNGVYTVTETITDKDGGSDTQTFKVTVNNVPPDVTPAADQASDEGSAKSFDLGSFDDPGANDNPWSVHVTWGDGSAATDLTKGSRGSLGSASHTYGDNGSYTVTVKVTDKDGGSDEATFKVEVANVDPTASLGNNGPVDEGSPATVSFSGQHDPSNADTAAGFHYAYACDNGSLAGATYAGSGAAASHQCTFADDGTYPVRARIIDKDGGFGEYTTNVVVKNVAPSVTAAADQASDEGSSASFDLGSFSDPGPDSPWKVHVDWGDGSSSDPADKGSTASLGSASHSYDDNGSYTVKVTVTDKDGGSGSASFKVTVANVAPTGSLANDGPVDEGSPATVSFSGQHDASNADTAAGLHYSYACNGLASSLATTYAGATDGASKQCTFADNGSYPVKGRIFDKDGGSSTYDTTVQVRNVKPSLTPPSDDNGVEGTSKTFGLGSFGDPGANDNPWHLHVTWGDGSAAYDHDYASRGALGMAPHAYDDNGVYTVTETITDKDGGSDTQTFKVTISNVAPTASLGNNGPVDEGSPVTVSFSGQHDASAADTAAGFHYAYSCSNGSLAGATYAGSGSAASAQCTFADNGTYTVRGRIMDKDDGATEYTTSVTVRNVAPTVTAPADDTASEGTSKSFALGSFSDPGPDSPWALDVDWGDGSSHFTASKSSTGSLGSASHTYADNGTYTVTVKVTDKDGGIGQNTFKVTVGNLPPTITAFSGTSTGLSGPLVFVPATFNGTFTDPGVNDNPWLAAWSWDGVADPTANQSYPAQGAFSQSHTYTTAGCNHTATVKITDKDGGFDTKTTTVGVGKGAFLPPMTNQPVTDKLRNGQVLPVKIQITDCAGAGVNNLTPAIRLVAGDQTTTPDDSAVTITPGSVSAADTTGVMRSNATDGSYIYNMSVNLAKLNSDYTVVIYPYGNGQATGPTMRHVIQATK